MGPSTANNHSSQVSYLAANQSDILEGDAAAVLDRIRPKSVELILTSPPYNIGKIYERGRRLSLEQYLVWLRPIAAKLVDKLVDGGSLCWQVGNYVKDGEVFPLDVYFYQIFRDLGLKLRNRIIWHFNFGLHAQLRLSGRYETLLWFTKGDKYTFNVDAIRVPQLYPGKRHSGAKGDLVGMPSGNPLGKNPSDVWEFSAEEAFKEDTIWELPNVKANHPEKTMHPCQFPSELAERCILAFTSEGDRVLDPFSGAGTTVVAAERHKRIGLGIDKSSDYVRLAKDRLKSFRTGDLRLRPGGMPVRKPKDGERVARYPKEWLDVE